ncbi:MAG: hypothetical protein KGM98_10790 [Bacteroidota bacterium]|nr:hypothetical protein [Bacteroidota bacterium]
MAQNYKSHVRYVPLYHIVLYVLLLLCLITSSWNLFRALSFHSGRLVAVSLVGLVLIGAILAWYSRVFALKAQDRAIRAEENIRHLALTGKLLDKRLHLSQIIALRFANDEEFLTLATKAAEEGMKASDIKQAIRDWKADYHRV